MAVQDDLWLQPWLGPLEAAAQAAPVLELGCDTGGDTAWLRAHGVAVVAADIARDALRACAQAAAGAHLLQLDLRRPLPFADGAFGVVIASLCLHYFDWATTLRAAAQVHRCVRPGGLLLCRLNSTADVLHGAQGYQEIEPHYYRVHGRYAECKRFFDRAHVERLFATGWECLSLREATIHRYAEPKVAWEVVLRRQAGAEFATIAA